MTAVVDNAVYDRLGARWYGPTDDPIALLRAEARHRNPWVLDRMRDALGARRCAVLDVGCGGGFLANDLARAGHAVVGLDAARDALRVAARHAPRAASVRFVQADALALPFASASFDVVTAMDFLEHVEDPARAIAEAARVLAPGGLFFFHTFDRNLLAWLVVIKGVEWFVKNTPERMHVLSMFIRPAELRDMCWRSGMVVCELRGSAPDTRRRAFWRMLASGVVGEDFAFRFTRWTRLGYTGFARKLA